MLRLFSPVLVTSILGAVLLHPAVVAAKTDWCRCPAGPILQPGLVNYKGNGDREVIARIEVDESDPEHRCQAAWIGFSEVYAKGTPYSFHLQRKHLRTIREEACGDAAERFVSRTKNYDFVPDADSQPIREIEPVPETTDDGSELRPIERSNANVWSSISTDPPQPSRIRRRPATQNASAPQFLRTAWVIARRDVAAHLVGFSRGPDQREIIIPLSKTRKVFAGELGQIEASNGRTAIVRFYGGSRREKFSRKKNLVRRWYNDAGGPYIETKDDLYTSLRACILEVQLDDIIEVNDYLDQQSKDET